MPEIYARGSVAVEIRRKQQEVSHQWALLGVELEIGEKAAGYEVSPTVRARIQKLGEALIAAGYLPRPEKALEEPCHPKN